MNITYENVAKAATILADVVHHTPVLTSHFANEVSGANLFFKCENFQKVGAFKFRGAYNAISQLTAAQKAKGIVAYSSGNHAQAIALAAKMLGVTATIVMPQDAPAIKRAATAGYGANIVLYDRKTQDRVTVTNQLIEQQGLSLIPPFDHPAVIAGQGTAAKELFEEVGELDYLLVPVGGGGLISGSALSAAKFAPNCKVIGVEPETGNDAQQSFRSKQIVTISEPATIADGAQTTAVGTLVLPILLKYVHDIITVSDTQLCQQMQFFATRMKIVVEPTGCLAAAAALNRVIDLQGARVGIIVSGGNVDMELFCCCVQKG